MESRLASGRRGEDSVPLRGLYIYSTYLVEVGIKIMKKIILFMAVLILLYPTPTSAKEKIWISNKTEVGYGPFFIAEQIKLVNGALTTTTMFVGTKIKLSEPLKLQTFYSLKHARSPTKWTPTHAVGIRVDFNIH